MIDLHRVLRGAGHLGVGIPLFGTARRNDFSVLDSRGRMAMGRGVLGNGVSGLLRPVREQSSGLPERLGVFGVPCQIGELIRILA